MARQVDIPKLIELVAGAYNVEELRGFLADYFTTRLDHIINPVGVGFVEIVRRVVDHFDARGGLPDLVRELQKDRPGVIDLLSLLLPPGARAPTASGPALPPPSPPAPPTSAASLPVRGHIDVEPGELDFYFMIEPDRRVVSPVSATRPTQSIYVRIPIAASGTGRSVVPCALSLAVDRSGSMAGDKTEIARAAADYLLDLAEGTSDKVAIVAFDDKIDVLVGLTSVQSASALKTRVLALSARGQTDLFAAWERSIGEVHSASPSFDRRVVLITDGQLNHGMVDPATFERKVRQVWTHEKIATSCISMGGDWNVELLDKLAAAGGGGLHFINDKHQAEQALHEAFHAGRGIVATNLRAELEPLGVARVTQVQGVSTNLMAGGISVHPIANQLRTHCEENLVLRIEFAPDPEQAAEVLRCKLLFRDPVTGLDRALPEKILRVYTDAAASAPGLAIVNQGVVCTAHAIMSHRLFKQALGAFLREEVVVGQDLLEQSRFSLEAAYTPPGYRAGVTLQQRRIADLEQFEGRVPVEYIKERYVEELVHRDVVWIKLCEVLDRLSGYRVNGNVEEMFRWADHMVDELEQQLPVRGEPERYGSGPSSQGAAPQANPSHSFWWERAHVWLQRVERSPAQGHDAHASDPTRLIVIVAGACFGFERWRQGTREELAELMDGYLHSFTGHGEVER